MAFTVLLQWCGSMWMVPQLSFLSPNVRRVYLILNRVVLLSDYNMYFVDIHKMTLNFKLGIAFRPYQQLVGVSPETSKDMISLAYQVRSTSLVWISQTQPILELGPHAEPRLPHPWLLSQRVLLPVRTGRLGGCCKDSVPGSKQATASNVRYVIIILILFSTMDNQLLSPQNEIVD